MKLKNKLPQTIRPSTGKISNSLEALGHHFKVPLKNLHTAQGDVELSKEVLRHLLSKLDFLP